MPESSTLEDTASTAIEIGSYISKINEVSDYQIYGGPAPFNFNGLVRHYYLRTRSNVADIQVSLVNKSRRKAQGHDIVKRIRPYVKEIAETHSARVKLAEVPPGPPVLSTLVAEIYGPDYERQREIGKKIMKIFETTPGVVDVDWYMEDDHDELNIIVDKEKSALHGISTDRVTQTLVLALKGVKTGLLHRPDEKEDVPIVVRVPLEMRASIDRLSSIKLSSSTGELVPVSDLVRIHK